MDEVEPGRRLLSAQIYLCRQVMKGSVGSSIRSIYFSSDKQPSHDEHIILINLNTHVYRLTFVTYIYIYDLPDIYLFVV